LFAAAQPAAGPYAALDLLASAAKVALAIPANAAVTVSAAA